MADPKTRPTAPLRRIEAMKAELEHASNEYLGVKANFDEARVAYEVAREKFAAVRRLAMNVMTAMDWYFWRVEHEPVQYTGLKLGEAIPDLLETHAFRMAGEYWDKTISGQPATYAPFMSLERIQEALERGGFEFKSASALREVNAALINAPDTKKVRNMFSHVRADAILNDMKPDPGPPDPPEPEPDAVPENEEEVPF